MNFQPHYDLSKRVYVVTGAGSGIGAATACLLVNCGAQVILVGRNQQKLEDATRHLNQPELVELYVADIAREDEVKQLASHIDSRYGRLDGAFNNAGIFGEFGLLENDLEANFDAVVNTNLKGVWACMKHQIPLLKATGGAIVNCASVAGHQGHAKSPVYSATKHAIIGLSKSASLQYAGAGVRINVLSPGSTDTPILRSIYRDETTFSQRAARAPMGRVGKPDEIAQAAVWLLSPYSSYVQGQTLIIDGGVLAGTAAAETTPQPSGHNNQQTQRKTAHASA